MSQNYYYKYDWDGSYCYDNSNILINKLGISDGSLLNEAERRITSLRISEILQTPVISKLYNHLKVIHKLLFSDIINVLLSGIITAIDKQTQKRFISIFKI